MEMSESKDIITANKPEKNINTKRIDEILENGVENKMAPGCSVVVTKGGKGIYSNSYGNFTNQSESPKIGVDTPFDLASITKLYTTALILTAQEKGILKIDDEVKKYLPVVFANSSLTITDLLTHRANINVYLSNLRKNPETFNKRVFEVAVPEEAQEEAHYQNITFIYLGKLLEKAYGQSLPDLFKEFFKENDFNNTYLGSIEAKRFNAPPSEVINGEFIQNITHDENARLLGGVAGHSGIFASSKELNRFGNLWLKGKIVSRDYLGNKVLKNYCSGSRSQGLGWNQDLYGYSTRELGVYLHPGFTGGLLAIDVDQDIVLSFLCNRGFYGRDNLKHRKVMEDLVETVYKNYI
jgi:CubicO group peptidase (beta-lactamase class C family)